MSKAQGLKQGINKRGDYATLSKHDQRAQLHEHQNDWQKPKFFSKFKKFPEFKNNRLVSHYQGGKCFPQNLSNLHPAQIKRSQFSRQQNKPKSQGRQAPEEISRQRFLGPDGARPMSLYSPELTLNPV